MWVPKCLLRYTVKALKVFIQLILVVRLSTTNVIGIKKKSKKKLEADIKAGREYLYKEVGDQMAQRKDTPPVGNRSGVCGGMWVVAGSLGVENWSVDEVY